MLDVVRNASSHLGGDSFRGSLEMSEVTIDSGTRVEAVSPRFRLSLPSSVKPIQSAVIMEFANSAAITDAGVYPRAGS